LNSGTEKIIMSPAPHPDHQRIVRSFFKRLDQLVESEQLGEVLFSPVDVVLTPHRVVQPDVLFIAKERAGIITSHIAGAPDLVMEVISVGSWHRVH
jgi:Uma2 family endonuclease